MFGIEVVQFSEVAVLRCQGRLVRSGAAYRLRAVVTAQSDARVVVLDFSDVTALEGGALGMLVFLQRWTRDNGVSFGLFNPSQAVQQNLRRAAAICDLRIISELEFLNLLGCYETQNAAAVPVAA